MFLVILGANIALAVFLAEVGKKEVCTAENIFSNGDNLNCSKIDYTERFGYRFNDKNLALGTKAYLAVLIEELELFNISSNALQPEKKEELVSKCNEDFDPLSSDTLCLEQLSFSKKLSQNEEVVSDIVLKRSLEDGLFELTINENNKIRVYHTDLTSPENYILNAVFLWVEEVPSADDPQVIELVEVATLDITMLPVFPDSVEKEVVVNSLIKNLVLSVGGNKRREEVFGISLSTRFARCCKTEGLSAFHYFGLCFDYTFLLEGVLTVFAAFLILKCLGYEAVDERGHVVMAAWSFVGSRHKQTFRGEAVSAKRELPREMILSEPGTEEETEMIEVKALVEAAKGSKPVEQTEGGAQSEEPPASAKASSPPTEPETEIPQPRFEERADLSISL